MPKGKITVCAENIMWKDTQPKITFEAEIGIDCFECILLSNGRGADFELNSKGRREIKKLARPKIKDLKFDVKHMVSGSFGIGYEEAKQLMEEAIVVRCNNIKKMEAELERAVEKARKEYDQYVASKEEKLTKISMSFQEQLKKLELGNTITAYG